MKIKELTNYLESIAPASYQESYDNAGLIVGHPDTEITGLMICLDSTEAVIDEAISKKCNVVIAHHPIVFKGLKRFNGNNYVERTIIKAIKNDIAIYAIHTNLDNVYLNGVNTKIAEIIGLQNTRILAPKTNLKKLFTFVPTTHGDAVRKALFEAGAGAVNDFRNLSYATVGAGSQDDFGGGQVKLEVLFPSALQGKVINALIKNHPEKKVAYDIITVESPNTNIGSGMIGTLKREMTAEGFLKQLKNSMQVGCVKYTDFHVEKVKTIAICGGSGGFLLRNAIAQKADVFVTSDYKYHEFFDANGRIIIADIGHYESEQYTIELLHTIITNKFSNFAAHCTKINTNPVNYI